MACSGRLSIQAASFTVMRIFSSHGSLLPAANKPSPAGRPPLPRFPAGESIVRSTSGLASDFLAVVCRLANVGAGSHAGLGADG